MVVGCKVESSMCEIEIQEVCLSVQFRVPDLIFRD